MSPLGNKVDNSILQKRLWRFIYGRSLNTLPFAVNEQLVGPSEAILDATLVDMHAVDVLKSR